ncbi:MAG: cob(I)yrinic acid a,c-diamide adenosyltransferase [Alphaproteobacteria bacterium]|nr:cob(I)yrinic acid a,c-diamide adenosyltransferase [Alphaproteobacteria bacterium]
MVKLDKIYTRGGDKGETSLGDGTRLSKTSTRIAAIGDVDEANSTIGLARAALPNDHPLSETLARIQNDLFDLGADLATPGNDAADGKLRIQEEQVTRLENEIDALNEPLSPLTSFILPGGSEAASRIHLARAIARRAERTATALTKTEPANRYALQYLNRLSDLLFVAARAENDGGRTDVLWVPGMNTTQKAN